MSLYEHRKIQHYLDALELNRPGYWACMKCGAHNRNLWSFCAICKEECWKYKMPTERLTMGPLLTLLQNVVYALPACRVRLFTNTAAPTVQQSNDPTFATVVAVVFVDGAAELSGGFLRVTTAAGALVTLKRA